MTSSVVSVDGIRRMLLGVVAKREVAINDSYLVVLDFEFVKVVITVAVDADIAVDTVVIALFVVCHK